MIPLHYHYRDDQPHPDCVRCQIERAGPFLVHEGAQFLFPPTSVSGKVLLVGTDAWGGIREHWCLSLGRAAEIAAEAVLGPPEAVPWRSWEIWGHAPGGWQVICRSCSA